MFKNQPILVLGATIAMACMICSIAVWLPRWRHAFGAFLGHVMGIE